MGEIVKSAQGRYQSDKIQRRPPDSTVHDFQWAFLTCTRVVVVVFVFFSSENGERFELLCVRDVCLISGRSRSRHRR